MNVQNLPGDPQLRRVHIIFPEFNVIQALALTGDYYIVQFVSGTECVRAINEIDGTYVGVNKIQLVSATPEQLNASEIMLSERLSQQSSGSGTWWRRDTQQLVAAHTTSYL